MDQRTEGLRYSALALELAIALALELALAGMYFFFIVISTCPCAVNSSFTKTTYRTLANILKNMHHGLLLDIWFRIFLITPFCGKFRK
jgi:mannose/fructose/N-acetylgalactosamine-specific phosphotransferase system component IID